MISFEKVFVVNLARRKDRLDRFYKDLPLDWPFVRPERYAAIDGKECPGPSWWKQGGGAWGCYRSHVNLIERCLNENVESVLLLEDDALCIPDFTEKVTAFLNQVPNDWGMIYLGGQHLSYDRHPPVRLKNDVYQPYNINRTHAFAIHRRMLGKVYKHLTETNDWRRGEHIDHRLGRLHQRRQDPIYCPPEWLIGQAEGRSNISGKTPPTRFWKHAEFIDRTDPDVIPFVLILGLHSSGSSCLAGVLHHLGVHMGNQFGGYYGNDPDNKCGFEAKHLMKLCETAIPFPQCQFQRDPSWIRKKIGAWVNEKRREAQTKGTLAGGKYPTLCQIGKELIDFIGADNLFVISSERPIEHSIESIQRRCPKIAPDKLQKHQEWLLKGKEEILSKIPNKLRINYYEMIADPNLAILTICDFLKLNPTDEQIEKALRTIKPEMQHIGEECHA